jgi:hypothetical protein
MWVEFMTAKNGYVAQVWQELFRAEGLSTLVQPPLRQARDISMRKPRTIFVPTGKAHVAREILRKI